MTKTPIELSLYIITNRTILFTKTNVITIIIILIAKHCFYSNATQMLWADGAKLSACAHCFILIFTF